MSSTPYGATLNQIFDDSFFISFPGDRPTNKMSNGGGGGRGGHHSRVPSLTSASTTSADRYLSDSDPQYQPPLNHFVKLFISLHNAILVPLVFRFTSALYAAISQVFRRPKCLTPHPSNGAIVVLNSTRGNAIPIPLHPISSGAVFLRNPLGVSTGRWLPCSYSHSDWYTW